jgi:hypothetical protein
VAHLASAAAVNAVNGSAVVVGGVDFAWKAIEAPEIVAIGRWSDDRFRANQGGV